MDGWMSSGFFLDYEAPNVPPVAPAPGAYHVGLQWVFNFQNSTSGVNQDCIQAHQATGDEYLCIFAEHTAPFISTPTFALNSKYDTWQQGNVLANRSDPTLMNQLGANITSRLMNNLLSKPQHGAFIDACSHHCGAWGTVLPIDGDEQSTAIIKFYYNITQQRLWNQQATYPCSSCCI